MKMNMSRYNIVFHQEKNVFHGKTRICVMVEKHVFLGQVGNSLACQFYRTFLGRKRDPFPRETH